MLVESQRGVLICDDESNHHSIGEPSSRAIRRQFGGGNSQTLVAARLKGFGVDDRRV